MKFLHFVIGALLLIPAISIAQITKSDSLAMSDLITEFKESIIQKDSLRFDSLFFSQSVDFTGIMSKKTEWSIKKGYPEFQGIAVSDHKSFISDICKSPKKQEEKFYNLSLSSDGAIGAITFDYAFYSDDNMFQWGHEKWNLAKDEEKWLITDVVYSIHFPHVEPFPYK
ncbi:MAG: hypothetical protein AAF242_02150 [Bacteroidota bacterium]